MQALEPPPFSHNGGKDLPTTLPIITPWGSAPQKDDVKCERKVGHVARADN